MAISTSTVHPLRWGAVLLLVLPALLWVLAAVTVFWNSAAARAFLRSARYVVAAELMFLLLIAILGASYQASESVRDRRLYPPPGRLVKIRAGLRLHLYCTGDGSPTVILESGLSGMSVGWYAVQPEVGLFARVCSYDRAGYGWSDSSSSPRTSIALAEELHDLLTSAAVKPPYVLVGHSMGGFNVHLYASRYPKEVAGMVLVDSSHPDELIDFSLRKRAWTKILWLTAPFGLPRWRGWCADGPKEIRATKAALCCRARYYSTQYAEMAAFAESARQARTAGSLGNIPLIVISRDSTLKRGTVMTGVQDGQEWSEKQQELSRLSSNAKLIIAERSGHAVQWDRPDVVISAIREVVLSVRNKKML